MIDWDTINVQFEENTSDKKEIQTSGVKLNPNCVLVVANKKPEMQKTGFSLPEPAQIYYQGRITRAGAIYKFWQLSGIELIKQITNRIRSRIERIELFTIDDSRYIVSEFHSICIKVLELAQQKNKLTINDLKQKIFDHMEKVEAQVVNNISCVSINQ